MTNVANDSKSQERIVASASEPENSRSAHFELLLIGDKVPYREDTRLSRKATIGDFCVAFSELDLATRRTDRMNRWFVGVRSHIH